MTLPTGSGIKTLTLPLDVSLRYLPVPLTVPPVDPPLLIARHLTSGLLPGILRAEVR